MKKDPKSLDPFKMELPLGSVTYLALRYSLEFVVVVLGITASFWLSEWSELQNDLQHQVKDAQDLLQDLESDAVRLAEVGAAADVGKERTLRILQNHTRMTEGGMTYAAFTDTMVNIGFPYSYITFFMNDGTYKTLLNNGRLQNFPTDLEESIKEYYEYVSKRASDNNAMIDNLSLNYFVGHHPMCMVKGDEFSMGAESDLDWPASARFVMNLPNMQERYKSDEFYVQTMVYRNRIVFHKSLIQRYENIRSKVETELRAYLAEHPDLEIKVD